MTGLAIFIAVMLYYNLDKIIELFKHQDPVNQKQQEQLDLEDEQVRAEIGQQLTSWVGLDCLVTSSDFLSMSLDSDEIDGTIVSVDHEWVELKILKNKMPLTIIIRLDNIWSVSRIL